MLFGLFDSHRGWPYPRGKRQIATVTVIVVGLIAVAAGGWGGWQWHEARSPLSADEVHIAASELASYTGEALLLVRDTGNQPVAENYRAAYIKQLQKDAGKAAKDLTKRPPQPGVAKKTARLLQSELELSGLLDQLANTHDTEEDPAIINRLETVQTKLQKTQDER